jgi:hypothetical protein
MQSNVERIFDAHIKGTPPQAIVRELTITFCSLTNEVQRVCSFDTGTVLITTKVIKKNYDKRTAEENDYILKNGWQVIHMPSSIYRNKSGKRGDFLFAKKMNNNLYVASLEVSQSEGEYSLYVVSVFRVRKESYLYGYELIWSWKGGEPSS